VEDVNNPFDELEAEGLAPEPTLESAAMEIHTALSLSHTAKGLHRPRPLSWGKRIARTHFGWSRIGEKKWNEILEIGARGGLWTIDEKKRLVYAEINESEAHLGSSWDNSNTNSPNSKGDMSAFYRSAGALGNWRMLSEDDWDGQTYAIIRLGWMDKAIEVPSWKAGQVRYELYDAKVREDIANGAERSYCTSCKSQVHVECLYLDSHDRIACSACNDLQDPRLVKPDGWVPPAPVKRKPEIKVSQAFVGGSAPSPKPKRTKKKKTAAKKLRDSVRKDGKADLMDASEAIRSADGPKL